MTKTLYLRASALVLLSAASFGAPALAQAPAGTGVPVAPAVVPDPTVADPGAPAPVMPADPAVAAPVTVPPSAGPVAPVEPELLEKKGYTETATIIDMYEVEASEIAEKRSTNAELKMLASMIDAAHETSLTEIKELADGKGVLLPRNMGPKREAMVKALEDAPAEAFDMAYIDQQVATHTDALAVHTNYAEQGDDADLRAFAKRQIEKIKSHLDQATALQAKLRASAPTVAGTPPTP